MGKTASRVFGLVLNLRTAFLAIVAVALSYGTALLAVIYAYRTVYGIVGRPELGLRFAAKCFASLKEKGNRMVARTRSLR